MNIISISGLDGSGKSTQINLLKNYLESQGKRVFYFHAVDFSIVNKIFKALRMLCYTCRRSTSSVTEEKSVEKSGKFGIWLRKFFLSVDLKRFKKLCENLENKGYDYILSDRYFYDSVINIYYLYIRHSEQRLSEVEEFNEGKIRSFAIAQDDILKPDLSLYLKVDPAIIMQRERKPDQGMEYLKKKKELYDAAASKWNLNIIDGNRQKEIIFEDIKKHLT